MALERLEDGIRRIVAPNPSPMTFRGTCSYVLGTGDVAVIDPGPANPAHLQAILDGLMPGERVAAVLVTHAHLDHSPGAPLLAEAVGARVYAFGPPQAGRSPLMQELAARGLTGGGEGVDHAFAPDVVLAHGETLARGDWEVEALHTPGHFCNHLSFAMGDAIFTGDVVMGWASTLISPPDGDLGDYFRSLDLLAARHARVFYPGHGEAVTETGAKLSELAEHRRDRSAQILARLAEGPATIAALVQAIYTDTPAALHPAAARNIFAHLIEMTRTNQVIATPHLTPDAVFERI